MTTDKPVKVGDRIRLLGQWNRDSGDYAIVESVGTDGEDYWDFVAGGYVFHYRHEGQDVDYSGWERCPDLEIVEDVEVEGVIHPSHYQFPNGVEVMDIVKYLDFPEGSAVKYIARAGRKTDDRLKDLHKALNCLNTAIELEEEKLVEGS